MLRQQLRFGSHECGQGGQVSWRAVPCFRRPCSPQSSTITYSLAQHLGSRMDKYYTRTSSRTVVLGAWVNPRTLLLELRAPVSLRSTALLDFVLAPLLRPLR
jgi:hypothetical protein